MSEDVTYRGKLIPVDLEGMTVEEKAREILGATELPDYYESYLEQLMDDDDYLYYSPSATLFRVESIQDESDGFMNMTANEDGTFDFHTRFYNGGTYLAEMLEDGLNEL